MTPEKLPYLAGFISFIFLFEFGRVYIWWCLGRVTEKCSGNQQCQGPNSCMQCYMSQPFELSSWFPFIFLHFHYSILLGGGRGYICCTLGLLLGL